MCILGEIRNGINKLLEVKCVFQFIKHCVALSPLFYKFFLVVQYLHECFEFKQQPSNGMPMLPNGSHLRDDEEVRI